MKKLKVIKKKIKRKISKRRDNHYIFIYNDFAIDGDTLK